MKKAVVIPTLSVVTIPALIGKSCIELRALSQSIFNHVQTFYSLTRVTSSEHFWILSQDDNSDLKSYRYFHLLISRRHNRTENFSLLWGGLRFPPAFRIQIKCFSLAKTFGIFQRNSQILVIKLKKVFRQSFDEFSSSRLRAEYEIWSSLSRSSIFLTQKRNPNIERLSSNLRIKAGRRTDAAICGWKEIIKKEDAVRRKRSRKNI